MTRANRKPSPSLLAAAMGLVCVGLPAAAQVDNYKIGKERWIEAHYPQAYPPLITYRAAPRGRTADVDYMLGTSGCRIADKRQWGGRVLNYVLYSYALTETSRERVIKERDQCQSTSTLAALTPQAIGGLDHLVAAGATAQGKLFYFSGSQAAAAYPARQVKALSDEEVDRRHVAVGQAAQMKAALAPLAPDGARVVIVGRYAFVTGAGQSDATLGALARQLDSYVAFLQSQYGITPPADYLTLYLMPDIASVRRIADKVHGLDVSPSTLGYAYQSDLSVTAMVAGGQSGTLLHELFHLLVRESFGDIPQWLDEGIASLYEVSARRGDRYEGLPNWRGRVLEMLWSDRPRLDEVVASPWFGFDMTAGELRGGDLSTERIAVHLAEARYFALYLQDKGKLQQVYRAFQARDPGGADDPGAAAVALVEHELGPMGMVQGDFERWFRTVGSRDSTDKPDAIPDAARSFSSPVQNAAPNAANAVVQGPMNAAADDAVPNAAACGKKGC